MRQGRSPLAAENEQVIAYAHELVGLRCPAPRESVVYGAVDVPAGSEAMLQKSTWQNPESKIHSPVPDLKSKTDMKFLVGIRRKPVGLKL